MLANRNADIVNMLLDGECDLNAKNTDGQTVLHIACLFGNVSIVKLLLSKGANANLIDALGVSAINYAISSDDTSTVSAVMDHNLTKDDSLKLLEKAISLCALKVVKFFINQQLIDPTPMIDVTDIFKNCLLYTSPSPRDRQKSRMPSSA